MLSFHELAILSSQLASANNRNRGARRAAAAADAENSSGASLSDKNAAILSNWLHSLEGNNTISAAALQQQQHQQHRQQRLTARQQQLQQQQQLQLHQQHQQQQQQQQAESKQHQQHQQEHFEESSSVRIFVSSTFADMRREREIVRRVAPRIAAFCEAIGVVATTVDLSWGVTAEQVTAHDAVRICLGEVLRADIVLVFVGHRYGSTPDAKALAAAAKTLPLPWLQPVLSASSSAAASAVSAASAPVSTSAAAYLASSSVTELEVRAAMQHVAPVHIHAFLRHNVEDSSDETATAKQRLASLRTAVACLPHAAEYAPLDSAHFVVEAAAAAAATNDDENKASMPFLASADELEDSVFESLKQSVLQLFAARAMRKPRKYEREKAIQTVYADRALAGFCADL